MKRNMKKVMILFVLIIFITGNFAAVAEPNIPPSDPIINGTQNGKKNTTYTYTVVSTDDDNDTLQYMFHFGDTSDLIWNTTLEFLPNGTTTTINHSWSTWGIYTIKVKAYDNKTYSGITDYVVLIDVLYVKNIGYLIDSDSDGIYDLFYCNETAEQTSVEKLVNGSYLINGDSDAEWDYIYYLVTDELTYIPPEPERDGPILYALIIGIILIMLIFIIIFLVTKKKK